MPKDEVLKTFKTQNPIEQNNSCNDLLNEINYKLIYIINEKLILIDLEWLVNLLLFSC